MTPSLPVRSAVVGAILGLAVAGGFLFTLNRPKASWSDEGTKDALVKAMRNGIPPGVWKVTEATGASRRRTVAPDPEDPCLCLYWTAEEEFRQVHACLKDVATRNWFRGDPDLFLRNYRPAGPPRAGVLGDRKAVFVTWGFEGSESAGKRVVAVDPSTGEILRVEDQAYDGRLLHAVEVEAAGVHPSKIVDTPRAELVAARRKAREPDGPVSVTIASRATKTWAEFVAAAPFPLYEPARAPKGFERVAWTWQRGEPKGSTSHRALDTVAVVMSDGMATMILFSARSGDMRELDEIVRNTSPAGSAGVCPPVAGNPDPIGEDAVTIWRRANACRTVLTREFKDTDVTVALISFNERPESVYVETMRSLVPVLR